VLHALSASAPFKRGYEHNLNEAMPVSAKRRRSQTPPEKHFDDDGNDHDDTGTSYFDPPPRKAPSANFSKLLQAAQPHAKKYRSIVKVCHLLVPWQHVC
jgi:hypothetical protein